jgi:hypothetical protein
MGLLALLLAMLACQTLAPSRPITAVLPTVTVESGFAATPENTGQTAAPAEAPAAAGEDPLPAGNGYEIRLHPEDGLYVGDLVSLEVIAPAGADTEDQQLSVAVNGQTIGSQAFRPYGIAGRSQATLMWAWDTRGLEAGSYDLAFSLQPGQSGSAESWHVPVLLHPAAVVPPPEPRARWETARTDCCVVHYITGTAAARDLPTLLPLMDAQARSAVARVEVAFTEPIEVVLLPRVLGHGGFASREIAVSYLDRNYASNDLAQVLHHEMVHILDRRKGGDYLPTLFTEGLAVFLSGGHYQREPLLARAAALPELGLYLPLGPLADDFYHSQHEIGYLQAGALVQFMVEEWGWDAFDAFYRGMQAPQDGRQSSAIEAGLQRELGISLGQLEARFLSELNRRPYYPDLAEDVRLTAELYDTIRDYQRALDPSAYFLTAWLPDSQEMRQRQIVADFLRHPSAPQNLALETLLVEAGQALRQGEHNQARRLIATVQARLESRTPVEAAEVQAE